MMDADAKALEVVAQHMQTTGTKVDLDILIAHALRQARADGMREAAEIARSLWGDHSEEIAAAIERAAEADATQHTATSSRG
jgi:hypothetical protein